MKYFLLFIIICFLLLGLFFLVNRIVFTKMNRENQFRKLWEKHVCEDLNWLEDSDLKDK